ncbi:MAG TPA: winged helix-turn-helix domain-containing protein, partial [Caulobacteraceae bacterium]|nr:winged helix-turn-helix domain-containing protein [Caulobacteraceae bacterium]
LGGLRVRPSRREVSAAGTRQVLQPRVMQVLVALSRSPNAVVSQRELINRCWSGLTVSDDAIGRCIGQLRRLATAWAEPPPFAIETIPGVGYRLAGTRIELGQPQADGAKAGPGLLRKPLVWIGVAAALIAALAGGLWLDRDALLPVPTRVAVLPFQAMGGEPETRNLAKSVPDEVLSMMGEIQITAVPSASGGASRDVGFEIDGSVRRDARETHVNVRLEDARSHAVLWSDEFIRANGAVSDLPSEAAAKVGDITRMAIFARQAQPPLKDDTALAALLEAHDLLRWNRTTDWARLLETARRPSAIQPDFAFGHSILATALAMAGWYGVMPEKKEAFFTEARQEAHRALALDSRDAAAWYALEITLPPTAVRAHEAILLEGIRRNGHPAAPLGGITANEARLLRSVGRLADAVPYLQRAQALDPLSAWNAAVLAQGYADLGRTGEADAAMAEGVRRWPNHPDIRRMRFWLAAYYGDPQSAEALLDDPLTRPADFNEPTLAAWRAWLAARRAPGEADRAARAIAGAGENLDPNTAVLMLSSLNRTALAYDRAEMARRDGVPVPAYILFLPPAASLRRDPRFPQLARDLKLDDYWRATGRWPDVCQPPHPEPECPALRALAQPPKA